MDWLILTLLSAFLLALSNIIQKNVLSKEHSLEFVIAMFGCSTIILIPNLYFLNYSLLTPNLLGLILIRSVLVASGFLFFMKALRHTELSASAPLGNLSSVIVLILGFLILGDRVSLFQLLGITLMIIGTYTLQLNHNHSFTEPFKILFKSKYFHYNILSIIFFGFSAILTKYVFNISEITSFDYMHISFIFGFLFLLIYYKFSGEKYYLIWKDAKNLGLLIFIISLLDIGSMFLYLSAVSIPGALISLIIPLRRLSSLIDVIIGGKMLGEKNLLKKTLSTSVILIGVFVLVL